MRRLSSLFDTYIPLAIGCLMIIGLAVWAITPLVVFTAMALLFICFGISRVINWRCRRGVNEYWETRTVEFGELECVSGQLVIADAAFPPRGDVIDHVRRAALRISGTVFERNGVSTLASLSVELGPDVAAAEKKTVTLLVDCGCACLVDANWQLGASGGGMDIARQSFRAAVRTLLGDGQSLCCPIRDAFGRPVGIVFCTGIGDGQYNAIVSRDAAGTRRLIVEFLSMEDE